MKLLECKRRYFYFKQVMIIENRFILLYYNVFSSILLAGSGTIPILAFVQSENNREKQTF